MGKANDTADAAIEALGAARVDGLKRGDVVGKYLAATAEVGTSMANLVKAMGAEHDALVPLWEAAGRDDVTDEGLGQMCRAALLTL